MEFKQKTPRQSVNKAYLRQGLSEGDINTFSDNLLKLIDSIDPRESEENVKNHLSKFLRDTYYKDNYEINPKGKTDLVIFTGKSAKKSKAGVLIEVKKPTNTMEMVTTDNLNAKAMHEIILYYFEERDKLNNNEIKHLIITNIFEWFIFDANQFDKLIYRKSKINKLFDIYVNDKKDKPFFYEEVSKIIPQIDAEITGTFFDFRKYEKNLKSEDVEVQEKLIPLFKILSTTHLLKIPFENDSNSLNKPFYSELLYIIGLEEKPKSGKRVIQRVNEKERQEESLIENIITKLRAHRILDDIDEEELEGETIEDRYFNIALELAITWINRILFLKLLESVLLNYHNDDTDYAFLATDKITEFDNLDTLFFEVLAEKMADRSKSVKERYSLIPYLNSSLFEPTALEKKATFIADLKDNLKLPIFSKSVLKKGGAKKGKKKPSLEYLLDFLAAYDFGVEGKEAIKKESKTIINASVLGRIFEKINGYKEGSFFTPGAITEYMCRETIRKTVIDKFSQYFKKEFDTFDGLGNFIRRNVYEPKEILTANKVINNLKFCDPAVGSGHFLVSALNEIIAIKSELGILCDKNGKTIELLAKVESDELIIEDKDEKQLQYALGKYGKPNAEMQRIQETIFHEKETIIENCLFGVDINQNSVKICQLRLWIELLKNAYYTKDSQYKELQTLPNIDINIKQGNSLVSRFRIDDRLSGFPAKTQQKMRLATEKYKEQVFLYKSTDEKTVKKNAEKEIERIKKTFSTIHDPSDKDYKLWKEKEVEQITKQSEIPFGDEKERKICGEKINKLAKEALLLKEKYEEKLKTLYGNAFEWRFEFPEILSEKGEFVGFDIVMGNPPYIGEKDHSELFKHYKKLSKWNSILTRRTNLYYAFLVNSYELLVSDGRCSLIVPNEILTSDYAKHIRTHLAKTTQINHIVDFNKNQVFKGVGANVMIFDYGKLTEKKERIYRKYVKSGVTENLFELDYDDRVFEAKYLKKNKYWRFVNEYDITNTELVTIDYYGLTTQQGVITGCNSAKGKLFNKVLESNPELSALSGLGVYVLEEGTDIEHRNGSTFINNTQDRTAPNWVKLNKIEQEYVKSLYRGNQIKKYTIEPTYSYLIWFHKGNYSSSSNYKIPNIIKHLENFKILLINRNTLEFVSMDKYNSTPDKGTLYNGDGDTQATLGKGNYYVLQKYAYGLDFEAPKILWQSRGEANFLYSTQPHYALSSVNYIYFPDKLPKYLKGLSKEQILTFLNGVLNSSLYQKFYKGNNNTGTKIKSLKIIKLNPDNPNHLRLAKEISKKVLEHLSNQTISQPKEIDDLVNELYSLKPDQVEEKTNDE